MREALIFESVGCLGNVVLVYRQLRRFHLPLHAKILKLQSSANVIKCGSALEKVSTRTHIVGMPTHKMLHIYRKQTKQ
ncbi:hypothetical protein T12_6453 [Trichinella patagoniensis]|uniref:Uncharacterized protein n=1 Tax=Trichinella patagoniensis TaxID=990121 RepID=A0A0V0ZRG1_9BILA|nr:hypothetical protein T12_6453 [Trichinella patagoniensis]